MGWEQVPVSVGIARRFCIEPACLLQPKSLLLCPT
jgi:hypothetical protein